MKRVAYIAHPVSGDVAKNITRIIFIARTISMNEPQVVPFVPYLVDLLSLDDCKPKERSLGILHGTEFFQRGIIDELRLYGPGISPGMWHEIRLARDYGIPIRAMTRATTKEFVNWNGD